MTPVEHCPGIYRGPRPTSRRDVQDLMSYLNVKTIINLQDGFFEKQEIRDEAQWCAEADVRCIHFPVNPLTPLRLVRLWQAVRLVELAMERGNVYVACRAGRDRTSVVLAAFDVWHLGYTVEDAIKRMLLEFRFHLRYVWWLPFVVRAIRKGQACLRPSPASPKSAPDSTP